MSDKDNTGKEKRQVNLFIIILFKVISHYIYNIIMSIEVLINEQVLLTENIEKDFNETYKRLLEGLKQIDGGDLIQSILKLGYIKQIVAGEVEEDIQSWGIDIDRCVNISKGKKNINCLCGKKHLGILNIFSHTALENRIVIGNKCIEQLQELRKICGLHKNLLDKIDAIMDKYKFWDRKRFYRRCRGCKKYEIKRDYEYTNPLNKHFCRFCLSTHKGRHYIPCEICLKPTPCKRTTTNEWRLKCYDCYKQTK
mgnify:FL=1